MGKLTRYRNIDTTSNAEQVTAEALLVDMLHMYHN